MKWNGSFFLVMIAFLFACEGTTTIKKKSKNNFIIHNESVFQARSLKGDSLFTKIDSGAQKKQINDLLEAERAYLNESTLDNLIWIGRREAYLGRYDLAIRTFTKAVSEYPEAFEPLRHRGHRYLSIRMFDEAIRDFEKAAILMNGSEIQIEQDGMPNKLNIPLSNVQFNVWYHLGLAHYLKGNWNDALEAYKNCLEVSINDDLRIATMDWYYMTLRKMGREKEAKELIKPVKNDMDIIENDAYFKRILMYKGEINPEKLLNVDENASDQKLQYVTQGYGLGNYYLTKGDTAMAKSIFQNVINTGYWSAFGYIASEMELAKL
ncbi:tetratricopeptide repeat protein [Belliella sp. R4-6]|uniref:Tetratricopeptide repeat protein n=1 Tax=Belliella alkalica TaxID=1730871 RepID=A0ABS9VA61_9BACT|nr:tetratricopeptide repeat protein [Belliella alkalica]MCH7413313.1 tetratricopeptide repeat protein [Belliella alkalica]